MIPSIVLNAHDLDCFFLFTVEAAERLVAAVWLNPKQSIDRRPQPPETAAEGSRATLRQVETSILSVAHLFTDAVQ